METQSTEDSIGMLMIPDISGFTDFVMSSEISVGKYITESLIQSIINSNILRLEISDIEGDAVLFYKYHYLPTFQETLMQIEHTHLEFSKELQQLSEHLELEIPLSLKTIVHYGAFTSYRIGKFKKLYGPTVVEAHKMLKNRIAQHPPYALFSDTFLKANFDQPERSTAAYDICDDCQYLPGIGYIHYL
ncbi:MAG: hypothetical protein BGO31_08520 [Bacteroidetes bacterium 43-16]|nr:MAG: hypothetical protein BGO31_08520 [Bacteroidetes bacterium 43-16]